LEMTDKTRKIFYPATLFIGLLLMIWQIEIYRNTIIDFRLLLGFVIIVTIITFLIDVKNYSKTYYEYSNTSLIFYSLLQYLFSAGLISCSAITLTNYYFADKDPIKKRYTIIHRSSLTGGKYHRDERKPTFYINYKGTEKELVFPHKYFDNMHSYKKIEFEVNQGLLGFDILKNKRLIK
ncbi:hypothetical protein, partial [uncultured Aquimarina sp.]|uniref:hypothetical protein n=1 Tax=uncultured Aquimarina sp. TaxID=575652 RepID=UPI0026142E47